MLVPVRITTRLGGGGGICQSLAPAERWARRRSAAALAWWIHPHAQAERRDASVRLMTMVREMCIHLRMLKLQPPTTAALHTVLVSRRLSEECVVCPFSLLVR